MEIDHWSFRLIFGLHANTARAAQDAYAKAITPEKRSSSLFDILINLVLKDRLERDGLYNHHIGVKTPLDEEL